MSKHLTWKNIFIFLSIITIMSVVLCTTAYFKSNEPKPVEVKLDEEYKMDTSKITIITTYINDSIVSTEKSVEFTNDHNKATTESIATIFILFFLFLGMAIGLFTILQ